MRQWRGWVGHRKTWKNTENRRVLLCCSVVLTAGAACAIAFTTASAQTKSAATSGEWKTLFDGASLDAWRGYKTDKVPEGWKILDGTLYKDTRVADLVTKDEFGDFELSLEWKISEGGNAGIFYRGTEEYEHIYWTGPEYQLLDNDKASDNTSPLTLAGAAYGLYPPVNGKPKPVGEWNATRIIAKGPHVEHWLNGTKVVEYELWSPDWEAKVQASKFKEWANYGRAKKGHIALQGDHSGTLAFRNIRMRELK